LALALPSPRMTSTALYHSSSLYSLPGPLHIFQLSICNSSSPLCVLCAFAVSFCQSIASSLKPQEYRAPRERQPLSVALYSHRMKKPATYRSKLSSRVPTGGVGRWRSVVARPRRGRGNLILHSAPPPIVPASKLYTTRTMLSSGKNFKMGNFGWVLSNSSPVLASRSVGKPIIGPNETPFFRTFRPGGANALHGRYRSLPLDISGELQPLITLETLNFELETLNSKL